MKFNIKNIILFLLLSLSIIDTAWSQEQTLKLKGLVVQDSIPIENITIINKNSKLGTSSNQFGEFYIFAQLGDCINFTSLTHQERNIIISNNHIQNKAITVYLENLVNELDEMMLQNPVDFDFSNIYTHKNIQLDKDFLENIKAPDLRSATDPTHTVMNTDIIGLFVLLGKTIFKKKVEEKKLYFKTEKEKKVFINNFIDKYGEDFFIENFKIPPHQVYLFVDFCGDNGLKDLFKSDEFTTFNFLVKQSENFKSIKP